jgi:hypothetical protein
VLTTLAHDEPVLWKDFVRCRYKQTRIESSKNFRGSIRLSAWVQGPNLTSAPQSSIASVPTANLG